MKELQQLYRSSDPKTFRFSDHKHYLAYLMTRMPATFGAVQTVLAHLPQDLALKKVLDLGSGPGTALWVIWEKFGPDIEAHALEHDSKWLEISQQLAANLPHTPKIQWQQKDLLQFTTEQSYDLVIASYALGEIPQSHQDKVVVQAWKGVSQVLALIEPGTPRGFECIKKAREVLMREGAFIYAPCAHQRACPMVKGDWCHFVTRLQRTDFQKRGKEGSLPYEDEKYSYLIALKPTSKQQLEPESKARIIKAPLRRSGHVSFDICAASGGLERRIVSRKQGELYRLNRKKEWGEGLV